MMVEMFTTKPPFWDCEPVAALFKIGAEAELDLRELIPDGMLFLTLRHRRCRGSGVSLYSLTFGVLRLLSHRGACGSKNLHGEMFQKVSSTVCALLCALLPRGLFPEHL